MASGFQNMTKIPELRRRLFYTLALLAVYRIGVFVTTPGVKRRGDGQDREPVVRDVPGLFNMFSGGALEKMSIFALGIMPYISSSIILQLLTVVIPKLEQIQKEGEAGRRRINQYTRYGCVILSLVQSYFIAGWLISNNSAYGHLGEVVPNPGWSFYLLTMISLTTGTAFIMWLGEQITERGIGNGISLIIFSGIVTDIPSALVRLASRASEGNITAFALAIMGLVVGVVIATIIFFERGQRCIPVQYAKRVVGRKMFGGQSTHLPLKVNTAGVIPPIFASSILMFPQQIASFLNNSYARAVSDALHPGDWRYNVLYIGLIVFFCYFYTAVTSIQLTSPTTCASTGACSGHSSRQGHRFLHRQSPHANHRRWRTLRVVICVLPNLLSDNLGVPFRFGERA